MPPKPSPPEITGLLMEVCRLYSDALHELQRCQPKTLKCSPRYKALLMAADRKMIEAGAAMGLPAAENRSIFDDQSN